MKTFFLIFMLIFAGVSVFAQNTDVAVLSKTEKGKRILGYFAAFNSGDEERLKNFFLENVAAESLKQRPVEPRLQFHRQLRNDLQSLEIKQIKALSDSEIKLLVQAKNGSWVNYSFRFENGAPYKMLGWMVEPAEQPEASAKYKAPATKAEMVSTLDKYLGERASENKFSGVVLVAKDDKPLFSKAYGLADREKNVPNNPDTKFNLGSINKLFTRIALGRLVKEGKISFDDKLGKYLPDYPNAEAREKVTIRQLVTMKSGIGDIFGDKYIRTPKDKLRKNSDFIPLFADAPLAFEPGTKQQYSNGSYVLLGAIIEKVSGQNYYDFVRDNIYKVVGMLNTESFENDRQPANTAHGYTRRNPKNELLNNADTRPFRGSAAGGGYSNAEDLLKFSVALKSGKLLVPNDEGVLVKEDGIGVAGGANGISAILLVDAQTGYTIIVLSNYDPPSAESTGRQIRDWTKEIVD